MPEGDNHDILDESQRQLQVAIVEMSGEFWKVDKGRYCIDYCFSFYKLRDK